MPKPKTAQDILVTELKEIYSAERQLARFVPKLSRKLANETLKHKLDERRDQGASVIEELDRIFEDMGVTKSRPKNVAAEGLIDDMAEHLEEIDDARLLDAVQLGAIQKLQHYCIASWGTTASLGRLLDEPEVVQLMERLLEEGRGMDEELTKLAETEINPAMLDSGEEADGEDAGDEEAGDPDKAGADDKGTKAKTKRRK